MKTQKSVFLYIIYTTKIKLKILHNELLQYSTKTLTHHSLTIKKSYNSSSCKYTPSPKLLNELKTKQLPVPVYFFHNCWLANHILQAWMNLAYTD